MGLVVTIGMGISTTCAETLKEAVDTAYRLNPGLEASRAGTRAAKERVTQAAARFGPTLTGDAGYAWSSRRVRQNGATVLRQQGFAPSLSLSLDQPLFTFGRLSAQRRIADAGYDASVAAMRASEQDLIANVIIAYAAVLRDGKLVAIAQENLTQLHETSGQIEARYAVRYATETELQQTHSRIYSGKAQLALAQGNLLASRNTYRNLTGHYPGTLAPLPHLPALPSSIEAAQRAARASSPVIEGARLEVAAAQGRIAEARGNARPYLGLQGSIARSPLSMGTDDPHELNGQIQFGLTMPFYSGGLLSAQTREAGQLADAAHQQLEQTARDLREDVASYWDQLAAIRRALPAYINAVSAAQAALDGAQQQQLAGQITALDVLDTARDLLISRQALAQAEAQLYVQHAMLLGAMGQLRADDFSSDTPPFDPNAYHARTPFGLPAGFPVGLLVDAVDRLALDTRFTPSAIGIENDAEPGHEMAPDPSEQTTP